ncbi:MAG: D-alanine--D-alanine ligase [SAR324 cluster bacterium]|nr:D-alanine--D-alanine ligase [SAR324 cluster bacterium]
MQTILLLCGGESGEHEVSLQSAKSIAESMPTDRYQVIAVGIDKNGQWLTGDPLFQNEDDPSRIALADNLRSAKIENRCLNGVFIDAVFPIIHGTYGEDGALQGLLQMQHVPFVGSGVLGSAMGMDKDVMKRLLLHAGLNCAKYVALYSWQETFPRYRDLVETLGPILFVKPCNLGSSVGISKVSREADYEPALAYAFEFDTKVIVESFIDGREIEVAVLGNEQSEASVPGEIIPGGDFYSYDAKYIDSDKTRLVIPAELSPDCVVEIQDIANKAFRLLELSGLARVDLFVERSGKIWVNELNTLPGFTNISMYPKLWEATGLTYPELIHQLIQLAIKRFQAEAHLKRNRF